MSTRISEELSLLVSSLTKLPGMGPRSARRAVFELVKRREVLLAPLIKQLKVIYEQVKACSVCGYVDARDPCGVCSDTSRDHQNICVVEESIDVWTMERIGLHFGAYHVLGGTLSAVDNIGPDQISLTALLQRIQRQDVREVTLALSATMEGQTTVHYILDMISNKVDRIFTLAQGMPLGGSLDYLDDGTLAVAFRRRSESTRTRRPDPPERAPV